MRILAAGSAMRSSAPCSSSSRSASCVMETKRTLSKDEWLRHQDESRHRHVVAVNRPLALAPSLYFGTRRCTYSDVVSVVTTVQPLPRFVHDATTTTTKPPPPKPAWDSPGPTTTKPSVDRTTEPLPFAMAGHYVHAPLEGDSPRASRFLARQSFALTEERAAFLTALHELRRQRFVVEHTAALVVQRVYRGFVLRRRFVTIKEKLRVRKRIRLNLVKVTKGTALITGEKERRARVLARQHDAARTLQNAFRRWRGRRVLQRERVLHAYEQRHKAVVAIQCVWRRALACAVTRKLRARRMDQQRQRLARLVARVYRGYCARQYVRRLRLANETRASQCLQRAVQCFHARKALVLERHRRTHTMHHYAARRIQQRVRGVQARAWVLTLRRNEAHAIRVACTLSIQRAVRGFLGRRRVQFVRLFDVHTRMWRLALLLTRIVRGFLARRRATYEQLDQETDLLVQIARGNTSTVVDLLDGFGLVDAPVELTTTRAATQQHALHVACRHGRMEIVAHVLPLFLARAPHLVYARNARGVTPLELAIAFGHETLASFLLTKTSELFVDAPWLHGTSRHVSHDQGHSHSHDGTRGRTRCLLLDAACHGMAAIVLKLLVLFPHLFTGRERDAWSQRTLLHEALRHPSDERGYATLDMLLTKLRVVAVDLMNTQDLVGFTPLHVAAMRGHLPAVQALLAFGADVTLKDREGRTAWRLALLHGHETCFLEIRRQWLGNASVGGSNLTTSPGNDAIDGDADLGKALAQAATRGRIGAMARHGVVADLQPHLARALLQAARKGETDYVQFLLEECHADVNACDPDDGTSDTSDSDGSDGDSLLMVVIRDKNRPLLRYLLEAFGDELTLTYVNKHGHSAMDMALQSPLLVTTLLQYGPTTPWLLPLGADTQHRSACHEAVRRGFDLRTWLRGYAFMPSMLVSLVDDHGRTPLHDAAAVGNVAAGTLLLHAGLRVDAVDAVDQRTPLHDACRSGTLALVRTMVRVCPAALWQRDAAGQLPIWYATQAHSRDQLGLLQLLVASMRPGVNEPNDAFRALETLVALAEKATGATGTDTDAGDTGTDSTLSAIIQRAF